MVALYALCKENNLKLGIVDCLRTAEEQDLLYAQDRSKPGAIVTYAQGNEYKSQHQWGIAFDFNQDVKGHTYDDLSFYTGWHIGKKHRLGMGRRLGSAEGLLPSLPNRLGRRCLPFIGSISYAGIVPKNMGQTGSQTLVCRNRSSKLSKEQKTIICF